jgi:CelD/BcsL family acetyltransferase involved in cellulose biosynthesis
MRQDGNARWTWLSGTSRHFRLALRRKARLLEAEAGETPKLIRRTELDQKLLQDFFVLEAAGWKGREGSAIQCAAETRAFYNHIAREASARGYFCLHSLELKGTMIAGSFGVSTTDCFYPMKMAYDEALRRSGPGQLMINGILQDCAQRGIPEVFFGGGNDRYKTSWTQETLPHFNGWIFNRSFPAQIAYQFKTRLLASMVRVGRRARSIWLEKRAKVHNANRPQTSA